MYEGCKDLLGPGGCLLLVVVWLLSASLSGVLLRVSGMPEEEAAPLLLSALLGMLWPALAPKWTGSVSCTCDCSPLLRLLPLLECTWTACRSAEQLMSAEEV